MRIYVGNLPYTTTTEELKAMFEPFGEVADVHLPTDRETGKPRGFAFVEIADDAQAEAAINGLNGKPMGGRNLTVNKAQERPSGGGGGGGRGGYGGGSRGGYGGGGNRRY